MGVGRVGYIVNMWYIVMCMSFYVMLCHTVHAGFTRAGEHVLCVYKYPLLYMYMFCREVIELRERTMHRWYKQDHPSPQHECIDRKKILKLPTSQL